MAQRVCPWWMGYFIDNPLRRLIHNPEKILGDYVKSGMTVLDVGCGMGIFSIAMAKMVGDDGRVIAVDLQQKMLDTLKRRAANAGVADRITTHRCAADRLGVNVHVDFVLAFAMVHEVPDQSRLFGEIHSCLNPEGKLFVAEPRLHVPEVAFDKTVTTAESVGFAVCDQPTVRRCRAVVLGKKD